MRDSIGKSAPKVLQHKPMHTILGVNGPDRVLRMLGLFRAEGFLAHVAGLSMPTSGKSPHTHVMSKISALPGLRTLRNLTVFTLPKVYRIGSRSSQSKR